MARQEAKTVVPRLRFPEFRRAAAWELKPLSALLTYERPEKYIVADTAYQSFGTPVLTANKSFILGYTPEVDGIYTELPAVIFDDFTTDRKYVDFPFKVKSSAIKILRAKDDDSLKVIFELMAGIKFEPKEHKRYYISEYQSLEVAIPDVSEQQKIADCLASLDDVIAAQGRKVEALKAHKRGLMQQLFPREGEVRPHLRFPEFRNAPEWKKCPLGEVVEVASGQVDPTKSPYRDMPHVGGENIEGETGDLSGLRTACEDGVISGKYLFNEGDILYSKIRPILNKVAAPEFGGVCSADIYPIRPASSELKRHFLLYLLRSASFMEYATEHSERGKIPKINREALLGYIARLPEIAEQQRIADCLASLDTQIAGEMNQLAALKTHKQGLMQQLFPAPQVAGA